MYTVLGYTDTNIDNGCDVEIFRDTARLAKDCARYYLTSKENTPIKRVLIRDKKNVCIFDKTRKGI